MLTGLSWTCSLPSTGMQSATTSLPSQVSTLFHAAGKLVFRTAACSDIAAPLHGSQFDSYTSYSTSNHALYNRSPSSMKVATLPYSIISSRMCSCRSVRRSAGWHCGAVGHAGVPDGAAAVRGGACRQPAPLVAAPALGPCQLAAWWVPASSPRCLHSEA